MIHPSYTELMEKINANHNGGDDSFITSRYSIVLATSKRARQLTDGSPARVKVTNGKLLSVAVEELYEGEVNIVEDNEAEGSDDEIIAAADDPIKAVSDNDDVVADDETAEKA